MFGAIESLIKFLLSEPVLPTPSVCEAIIFFVPSPAENVMATLNAPAVQVADDGEARPAPLKLTAKPVSQVPTSVTPVCATVFTAGPVMITLGTLLSRLKFLLSVPVLPAVSVCEATKFLTPSPAEKITLALKALPEQVVVIGVTVPAPLISTLKPDSHVPLNTKPVA